MRRLLLSGISIATAAFLAGCSGTPAGNLNDAQYWQRVSASDATFTRGPKAQAMLNRDIARCVVELREMERMGVLREAIPTDNAGRVLDPPAAEMARWDTPDHDGPLLAEYSDYQDFEGCMFDKGWERVAHLPFDIAITARDEYLDTLKGYQYQSRYRRPHTQEDGEYKDLND